MRMNCKLLMLGDKLDMIVDVEQLHIGLVELVVG